MLSMPGRPRRTARLARALNRGVDTELTVSPLSGNNAWPGCAAVNRIIVDATDDRPCRFESWHSRGQVGDARRPRPLPWRNQITPMVHAALLRGHHG